MSSARGYGQFCPVSMAAEILAVRWMPIVLRELLYGSTRFQELRRGIPLISPTMLSQRLHELIDAGLVQQEASAHPGGKYRLTKAGLEMRPVIEQLGAWGQRWMHHRITDSHLEPSFLMWAFHRHMRLEALGAGRVTVLANPAFSAYSTPDGNIYLAMGWLKNLENADEAAAILAHELSHVLLAHHSSDIVSEMQHKGQALQEIAIRVKADQSKSKTVTKSDAKTVSQAQLVADATDKLILPAWGRQQEREADLLGVDLMLRASYSPGAMVSMLEKLKAWEDPNMESDDLFWTRVMQALQTDAGQAVNMVYKKAVSVVSVNHPKTEDRINGVAQYIDRHYGDKKLPDMHPAELKEVMSRPDVAGLVKNYESAFQAKKDLDANKAVDSYAEAKIAATPPTASDAYPNWILARAASALHRQSGAFTEQSSVCASASWVLPAFLSNRIFSGLHRGAPPKTEEALSVQVSAVRIFEACS